MYLREIDLTRILVERSVFLFGPRQTGKTTLLRTRYPEAVFYNLREADTFRDLAARPEMVRRSLAGTESLIVIDEIQRLPGLLGEVQVMLDRDPRVRFVLTGSSARALRRGGVNLLGGRARVAHLFPLVAPELGFAGLDRRLNVGSLPAVFDSSSPQQDLKVYVGTYLQEEIRAEGWVRSLETFSRFLEVAALSNGKLLNFSEVGSDAGVPPRTVREHFQLLADTLLGTLMEPWRAGKKRKPVAAAKFYLFDVGVANHLMRRRSVERGSAEYGEALEHLVFLELQAYLGYRRLDLPLNFWAAHGGLEVDFLVGGDTAIEVKAAERIAPRAFHGLRALAEETPLRRRILVSHEPRPWRSEDGVEVLPVEEFLRRLWDGVIIPP
jgi:predicted AAA+ superfamily ATPase